jgi:hypothetical protein
MTLMADERREDPERVFTKVLKEVPPPDRRQPSREP